MATDVYETTPSKPGEQPRCFEIKQNMKNAPLTCHLGTGKPIRRVVLRGVGTLSSTSGRSSDSSGGRAPDGCGG
jgi:hypothetical protein